MQHIPSIPMPAALRAITRGAAVLGIAALPLLASGTAHAAISLARMESDGAADVAVQTPLGAASLAPAVAMPTASAADSESAPAVAVAELDMEQPASVVADTEDVSAEEPTDEAATPPAVEDTASAAPRQPAARDAADPTEQQAAALPMRALPLFSPTWPVRGIITTYFGEVGETSPRGHAGLDIANDTGTPVRSAAEGTVITAGWDPNGYGNLVVVEHPGGFQTWYAHLSSVAVEPGEKVTLGEKVGGMGSTGYSTGSHLHFEVRQDGKIQDPETFLP